MARINGWHLWGASWVALNVALVTLPDTRWQIVPMTLALWLVIAAIVKAGEHA